MLEQYGSDKSNPESVIYVDNPHNIYEQLLFSTVRIEAYDCKGLPSCVGTGFFLQRQIKPEAYKIYLVTNRHVLHQEVESISIWFTRAKNGIPLIGQTEHFTIQGTNKMIMHPDVDLALLDCTALFSSFPERLYFKAVSYEMLASFDESELSIAETIFFIGYPEGIYDSCNGLPLLRTGVIASLPQVDYDSLPQFVIDAQVFPGSSGSPVFTTFNLDGKPQTIKLLGIVTASFFKNIKLTHRGLSEEHITENPLGLGIVIKSTCIKKMIDEISEYGM